MIANEVDFILFRLDRRKLSDCSSIQILSIVSLAVYVFTLHFIFIMQTTDNMNQTIVFF